jgi:hypothetical protein
MRDQKQDGKESRREHYDARGHAQQGKVHVVMLMRKCLYMHKNRLSAHTKGTSGANERAVNELTLLNV